MHYTKSTVKAITNTQLLWHLFITVDILKCNECKSGFEYPEGENWSPKTKRGSEAFCGSQDPPIAIQTPCPGTGPVGPGPHLILSPMTFLYIPISWTNLSFPSIFPSLIRMMTTLPWFPAQNYLIFTFEGQGQIFTILQNLLKKCLLPCLSSQSVTIKAHGTCHSVYVCFPHLTKIKAVVSTWYSEHVSRPLIKFNHQYIVSIFSDIFLNI
jgi:hypothetical protein